MTADREERVAPPPAGFPQEVPVASNDRLPTSTWVRLANIAHANHFFASLKSRLTPSSGRFPCVYLASRLETAVAELWGDRWVLATRRGQSVFVIPADKAAEQRFFTTGPLPDLRLCDFTDADTLLALGLEAAAIYTVDLAIPQAWAEMIANHPNAYDGIIYRSRHTGEICLVLWSRPGANDLSPKISFTISESFRESRAAYTIAEKIGIKLSFPLAGHPAM